MTEKNSEKAINYDEQAERLRRAFYAQHQPAQPVSEYWVCEATDEYVIAGAGEKYFRVAYTIQDDDILFAPPALWVEVEKQTEWVEAVKAQMLKYGARNSRDDRGRVRKVRNLLNEAVGITLEIEPDDDDPAPDPDLVTIVYGGEVKALGDGRIGGYLVSFGDPHNTDLEGEYFTADTDFGEAEASAVYYQHGLDVKLGKRRIGRATLRKDEFGVWAEAQIEMRDEYEKFIYEMAVGGKLGWSSGTASHLVEREPVGKAVWLKTWPLGLDASLTPTPAEPQNRAVPLKSLATPENLIQPAEDTSEPEGEAQAAGDAVQSEGANVEPATVKSYHPTGENTMSDNQTPENALEQKVTGLEDSLKAIAGQIESITKFMQDSPAIRKSGLYTEDGGAADPHVKSKADFLMAVKRGDAKRLREVYHSTKASTDGMETDSGEAGGYMVPTEYSLEFLNTAMASSQILPLVRRVPVGGQAGTYPSLDYFTAPTAGAGNTAMSAGVKPSKHKERGTFGETRPKFERINWRLHKIGDIVPVSNELVEDSPQAIESLLTDLIGIAIGAKEEYYVLRGTGVGEPLGILNAPAAIGVGPDTDNVFAYADALEMISRFKKLTNNARWVAHQSVMPDWGSWELGTAGAAAPKITDLGFGEPILSEHLPQANNAGCVGLFDLGAYLLFVKGGLEIAYSPHAYFDSDEVAWRFKERLDGQPWLKNSITLADPQGSFTVSPFVYFND